MSVNHAPDASSLSGGYSLVGNSDAGAAAQGHDAINFNRFPALVVKFKYMLASGRPYRSEIKRILICFKPILSGNKKRRTEQPKRKQNKAAHYCHKTVVMKFRHKNHPLGHETSFKASEHRRLSHSVTEFPQEGENYKSHSTSPGRESTQPIAGQNFCCQQGLQRSFCCLEYGLLPAIPRFAPRLFRGTAHSCDRRK